MSDIAASDADRSSVAGTRMSWVGQARDPSWVRLCRFAAALTGCPRAVATLLGTDGPEPFAASGPAGAVSGATRELIDRAVRTCGAVTDGRGAAAVPFVVSGQVVGALAVSGGPVGRLDADRVADLESVANEVAHRLEERSAHQSGSPVVLLDPIHGSEQQLLVAGAAEILDLVASGAAPGTTMTRLLELLTEAAPRLRGVVHDFSPSGRGTEQASLVGAEALPVGLREGLEAMAATDLLGAPAELDKLTRRHGIGGWTTFAVSDRGRGVPVAALTVFWASGPDLTPGEVQTCAHYHHLIEMVVGRHRVDRELTFLTKRDPLTGLYNRGTFVELVTVALGRRRRGVAAVFAIGLDQFRTINSSFGHDAGDESLRAVAELLSAGAGDESIVARAVGDEFLVYVDGLRDEHEAVRVGTSLRQALAAPFRFEDGQAALTASIGVAISPPRENVTVSQLIRDADLAMHRAKALGRGRTELFNEDLRARSELRLALETGLDLALQDNQFVSHYQPIVDIATGTLRGVEALIRWHHPTLGLVPPADFIGVAEETGAIVGIGRWMLATACRDAAAWRSIRPDRPLRVSVNLSARQLKDSELAAFLRGILTDTELEPALLCLEITESVLMEDAPAAVASLRRLKALGVQLAVDDFGTGYSSLAYLKRFPVDELKIDGSFVKGLGREPEDTAIVAAVIGLADALGLDAVAEGVETGAQARELIRLGATTAQGFLWSRPMTEDRVRDMLGSMTLAPSEPLVFDALTDGPPQTAEPPADEIIAVLAHELRTPLTVIAGYADMLDTLDREEDRTAAFDALRRNAARMQGVLDSFNALRDLDEGTLAIKRSSVDASALIEDVVRDAGPTLRGHDLVVGPVPACTLDVDGIRVQQILVNLLTNAAKYSPAGTTISLDTSSERSEITIVVADQGAGIPPEQVAVAFRKFGRLDRRRKGTGIGLYLARGFARAHGGDLTYRRAAGGGSELWLTLPLVPSGS